MVEFCLSGPGLCSRPCHHVSLMLYPFSPVIYYCCLTFSLTFALPNPVDEYPEAPSISFPPLITAPSQTLQWTCRGSGLLGFIHCRRRIYTITNSPFVFFCVLRFCCFCIAPVFNLILLSPPFSHSLYLIIFLYIDFMLLVPCR